MEIRVDRMQGTTIGTVECNVPKAFGEMMIHVLDGILVLIKTRNYNFTFSVLEQEKSDAGFNNIINSG